MVYERPGRGHSSPGYSYSGKNYYREPTPKEKEQARIKEQKRQERQQLEQTVKTTSALLPADAKELVQQGAVKERRLWLEFLETLGKHFDSEVVVIVGATTVDGVLPFGDLVAAGVALSIAVEIYQNWNSLWAETISQIVTTHEPGNQIYETPTGEQVETSRHTGHEPEKVETGTPEFDIQSAPRTPNNTQHGEIEKPVASDYVMESRWSSSYHYQKNAPQVNYKNQVHHLITDAESQQSDLALEAYERGLWNVDRTTNLIRLPSTKAAYQQSPIKIKHRGSHSNWSRHSRDVLKEAEDDLKEQYTTLDNVPDAILQQTLDQVESELRNDLSDIDEGIQEGWIKVKPDGTQKLSSEEDGAEIA